ncbi:DNA/RNA helicase domain-containing protein [Nocardia sp. NPDC058379]|uniref:DNA/RNA helicase domain-containing protein n=1 Tax=unclassified Nocardia TaxID=2637762 RepID=UPI00364AA424
MVERALRTTAAEVMEWSLEAVLAEMIVERQRRKPGQRNSQTRSWEASLPEIAKDLLEAGLGDVEMLIEFRLPETRSRADVILAGINPHTGADSYVVVELKQWSKAELAYNCDRIVRASGVRDEELHPIDQVRGYCRYLAQYIEVLHDRPQSVHGAAYLHNATENSISTLRARQPDQFGRLFTGERRAEFQAFLASRLAPGASASSAERLLDSTILPRPDLITFTASELREATEYSLIDNQELAYQRVLEQVRLSHERDQKSVVIVTGGPGSGKSLIAVTLLAQLHRDGYKVRHATGSNAFTETLRKYPAKGSTELKGLFQYYRTFANYRQNQLDVLICDEAHRIRAVSTNRFTPKAERERRIDRPQIDELIAAAKVPVFLLDEHQVVRPGEVGTQNEIQSHATRAGYPVHTIELDGLFRCGGSDEYDEWVRRLLGLRVGGPTLWTDDRRFEVRVARSPQEMQDFLRTKQDAGESARITAGYCWPWSVPNEDGSLVDDVRIGSWSMPWNSKATRTLDGVPSSSFWATDPAGFEQVGCIYTAQGFEYDWAGVIIGPDLVARHGRLVSARNANRDKPMKSKTLFDEDFDRLIRNVYKVLLTRGMRGVVIYSTDPETQRLLTDLVPLTNMSQVQ